MVTGGSRGIGAACARVLHREGWRVIISGKADSPHGRAAAEALGAEFIPADMEKPDEVQALFAATGGLDLLLCCAGVAHYGLLQDMTDEEWEHLFSVNTEGVFRCCRAAIPEMVHRKRGCILLTSSVWGVHGGSCEAAYSASKAAIIGLTKALAKELGPSNIRVNCVAPGVIDTDMIAHLGPEDRAALAEDTPLGRLGTPEDVAETVAFLASDKAAFLTGQIIGVDGGFAL